MIPARVKPSGPLSWLLPKVGGKDWHAVLCSSFEERCLSLAEWAATKHLVLKSASIFRIENPSSPQWVLAKPIVDDHLKRLMILLDTATINRFDVDLLAGLNTSMPMHSLIPDEVDSVLLDISTMPKRFFLFALKRLMVASQVRNLVVTYSQPKSYPEGPLSESALPPTFLTGYAREEAPGEDLRIVVSIGFVALSVDELFEQARRGKLDFLFPFPSSVPAFRRNWSLFSKLIPNELPPTTQVHRVDGLDAFEVCARLLAWGRYSDLDLLPLGPKTHALGMAMACLRLGGHAQLVYSQPQIYNPEYSLGIAREANGEPGIYGYCLKRNGIALF